MAEDSIAGTTGMRLPERADLGSASPPQAAFWRQGASLGTDTASSGVPTESSFISTVAVVLWGAQTGLPAELRAYETTFLPPDEF